MAKNNKKNYRTTVHVGMQNGKPVRKTIRASSKTELNKKVNALKNEVQKGKDVYTAAYFGDWADKWYNEQKLPSNISESALTVIQSTIKHLNKYFEKEQLKNINL